MFVAFGLVVAAFFPFFALYLDDRGLSKGEIGLVLAVMAVARVVSNPVWGHVADMVIGRLTALRLGAAGSALTALLLNGVDGLTAIAVVAFANAMFFVSTGPNIDAIALVHLGDERMHDYGRIRSWESLAYAAACLAYGAVLEGAGVRWAMPLLAAASLGVLVWSVTLLRDRPAPSETRHGRLGSVGAVFRAAPRFWVFLVAVLLVWTGFNAAWNYFSLRIQDAGGGPLLVGIGTALGGLVEVGVMRSSTRLQRRFGLRLIYPFGCLVYGTGFLLWGLVEDPTILSILTFLEGIGFSLLFTSTVVIVGRMLPDSLYSTGNGLAMTVGFGFGPIIGAGLGGVVYEGVGPVVLYAGASALCVAAAVVAWFALRLPALEKPRVDG
jgi:MFS transporter, PPP family, 3-phenylpropionic acid transporter